MKKIFLLHFILSLFFYISKAQDCNNWLKINNAFDAVTLGDLDITGTQMTIEASFNATGDITRTLVSKHIDPADVNYHLLPDLAQITTTDGFFFVVAPCDFIKNKTYHVAMVYDGITLKLYRNGYFMGSTPATGNLITNDWPTAIGENSYAAYSHNISNSHPLMGFINEVRIWNIARTQSQVKAYMNTSLPNPASQTGLLAYYTFDNLLNKQGNTAFNGSLNGTASINAANTSCPFIADSCVVTSTCNNWLSTPSNPSYAEMGQINITGNKITVEATINRTTPYTGGLLYAGDIVSKHNTPLDVNYLLRPNNAEITTSNGYFRTPDICEIELNKTYHVAMVYDGATLKFYRNGFLMSQVAASGNLFQNTWKTRIGYYEPQAFNTNFIGYTNEVRIWDVAKTQPELRTYINSTLPNPTTQTGLVAYYTFDNLKNKQGNVAYDGILGGSAAIIQTNPDCTLTIDSCATIVPSNGIGGIINDYTPVISLNPCNNEIAVENSAKYSIGDTVMIIQMKGAIIDSSNTASFGTIADYKNTGNYEFNYVKSKAGNIIELSNSLTLQFDIPIGKVQLIRVPYFNSTNISSTLTCLPWDGTKGGVLVLNVKDSLNLFADIDLSGKGFRGGNSPNTGSTTTYCFQNDYFYPASSLPAAAKGEGIASISHDIAWGKGASANGGGGGLGHNSGGGGGSSGGIGGLGGYQLEACGNAPFDNRGIGGKSLVYNNVDNKIFMGGGGGSGHVDNAEGSPMEGGTGGGIVIINTTYIKANDFKIIAKGGDAPQCSSPAYKNCHDGSGGGGGGGIILINANTYLSPLQLNVAGGKGADLDIFDSAAGAGRIGPGGGGGAGITWLNSGSLPGNVTTILSGGMNGVIPADNNNPWGATQGQAGTNLFNLKIPVDTIPFKNNIDSVIIKDSIISCNNFDFKGIAYIGNYPVTQWQWNFGDGDTSGIQNTNHAYFNSGTFTVSLIITDIKGCKDSTTTTVTSTGSTTDFSYKQDICNPLSIRFFTIGNTPGNPTWLFGDGSSVAGSANPTHLYPATGTYTVKYYSQTGTCVDSILKNILVNTINEDIILTPDTTICFDYTKQLFTSPALSFCWSPDTYLNDPNSPNPITSATESITYFFTAEIPGSNIITNGDFNLGNTGFTSQYNFANPNIQEDQYFVGTNPQAWYPAFSSCPDHTNGNGNMMLVNGAPVPDKIIWSQTVSVFPNTNYAFSTWIQAIYPTNPAQLSFSINGSNMGSLITASLPACTWNQFYTTWNSGKNTTATISIVNKNTFVQGNDFALDDISFSPVLIKRDSVKITIDTPHVITNADTAICAGYPVQLTAAGAVTYSWLPSAGLSNSGIANPVATPAGTTQYIVSGTNDKGCSSSDTMNIFIKPPPAITKSRDTTVCRNIPIQLFAGGGTSYSWSPASSLNNAGIATPIAYPTVNTTYLVTVTGINNCSNTDSVIITTYPLPSFTVSPNKATCQNSSVTLSAGGGSSYLWRPSAFLSNPNVSNPVSNATTTTTFTVKIKDNTCNDSTTLTTTITISPAPVVRAAKLNDIDCVFPGAQLAASGAHKYVWSPQTGLNNSNIFNPIASIKTTMQYLVTGTDTISDCTGTDTITVFIKLPFEPAFFVPNAFSPNGDGKNDCFRVNNFGTVKSVDFSIFNRWGNLIFHTKNVNDCWDGTCKGSPADPGNYIYFIKSYNECGENVRKGSLLLIR
ncbi:MAG: LamG-like jellyroll fold domain-containing protein [Ferruginibacter sp.]